MSSPHLSMFSGSHSPPCRAVLVSPWQLALGKPLEYYHYLFMKCCHLLWFSDGVEAYMGISLRSSWRGTDATVGEFLLDKGHKFSKIFGWSLNSLFNQMPNHVSACLLAVAQSQQMSCSAPCRWLCMRLPSALVLCTHRMLSRRAALRMSYVYSTFRHNITGFYFFLHSAERQKMILNIFVVVVVRKLYIYL